MEELKQLMRTRVPRKSHAWRTLLAKLIDCVIAGCSSLSFHPGIKVKTSLAADPTPYFDPYRAEAVLHYAAPGSTDSNLGWILAEHKIYLILTPWPGVLSPGNTAGLGCPRRHFFLLRASYTVLMRGFALGGFAFQFHVTTSENGFGLLMNDTIYVIPVTVRYRRSEVDGEDVGKGKLGVVDPVISRKSKIDEAQSPATLFRAYLRPGVAQQDWN